MDVVQVHGCLLRFHLNRYVCTKPDQTKVKPDLNNVSMFSVYYLAGKKTKFLFDRTSSIEAGKRCE